MVPETKVGSKSSPLTVTAVSHCLLDLLETLHCVGLEFHVQNAKRVCGGKKCVPLNYKIWFGPRNVCLLCPGTKGEGESSRQG